MTATTATRTLQQALEIYETVATNQILKERAKGIHEALKGLTGEENIAAIATREDKYLRSRYRPASMGTVMSRAGYYKLLEGELKLVEGENAQAVTREKNGKPVTILRHWFFKYCGLSKAEFYPQGEVENEWVDRNASSEVYDKSQVEVEVYPEKQIGKAYNLLQSPNPWEIGAGLIAVSGRRPHEIVARAKFAKIKGEEYRVEFAGQGKKRGEKPVFPISILVPVEEFMKAFRRFKSSPAVKDVISRAKQEAPNDIPEQNRKIDSLSNKKLNRVVKREFKEILPPRIEDEDFTPSEENEADINNTALKAAYLVIATKRDLGEASILRQLVYASQLAGHFIDPKDKDARKRADSELKRHIPATLHYTSYHIKGDVPYFEPPKPSVPVSKLPQTRLTPEDKAQLEEWCELWETPNQAEAMSKVFELARQALTAQSQPQPTEEKETEAVDNTAVKQLEEKLEAYQQQTQQQIQQILEALQGQQQATAEAIAEPTEQPQSEKKQKPAEPAKDWESVSKAELFGEGEEYNTPAKGMGAAEERVRRAIQAIMDWNNQFPAESHQERKWSINIRAVRDLAGVNNQTVKEFIESHPGWVDDHNQKHGIPNQYHNRCHKAESKTSTDLIREEVYPLIC